MNAHQKATKFLLGFVERFGDGDHSLKATQFREALENEAAAANKPKPAPKQESTVKPEDEDKKEAK